MKDGALSGIKVLDLSRLLPIPYCSMILPDHGADVISIEDKRFMDEAAFPKKMEVKPGLLEYRLN